MDVRRVALALVVSLLVVAGCAREPRTIRILSLGDSYTIGQGVAEMDRWPNQLGRALEAESGDTVEVSIVAQTGWTTSHLDRGIDTAAPEGPFDLVTLLIGVNNQFRGLDPEGYRTEFRALLDRAFGFSSGPVLVVSIPDWGTTPAGGGYDRAQVALEIDEFNAIAESETRRAGAEWVDITPISRSDVVGLVAPDQLHPSALQYGLWVEEMLPIARDLLDG